MQIKSLRKEAALAFLAGFYFLIATNTQTGWLFLMSAFMLGILALSWVAPRRAIQGLATQRTLLGSIQRGVPFSVKLELLNSRKSTARETLLEISTQTWAEQPSSFRWAVPRLGSGARISTEFQLTPNLRGEHRLSGTRLTCGAPFGLFSVYRESEESSSFLVYPKLESLPSRHRKSRLAGILTELSAPHQKGDSRTLRSLREYRPGDDMRMVHWKSSAKRGGRTLLVREHQAPSRQLSFVVLDTSSDSPADGPDPLFEKTVSLAASLLWAAHRSGTRSCLALQTQQGKWQYLRRWQEQYLALARVEQNSEVDFPGWQESARLELANQLTAPVLLTTWPLCAAQRKWPDWPVATIATVLAEEASGFPRETRVTAVDSQQDGFVEYRG